MKKSPFEGIFVVAKFFPSKSPQGKLTFISRTLGKFSVVDRSFEGTIENQDIWVCKIIKEINPKKNTGAFILLPVKKVEDTETKIRKIIPGFYDVESVGKAALVTPNTDPADYWILSKSTRQIFSKRYYAVVVPIQFEEKMENKNPEKPKFYEEQPEPLAGEDLHAS